MTSPTAGQAHPYWYEWFVGAEEIISMLRPDSDVVSVALQMSGIKGWDDVVVRLKDGRSRLYQVKHSRAADRLTFGDMVTVVDGESMLGALFASWRTLGHAKGTHQCVLYTNRVAGERPGTSRSGVRRPPLTDFLTWLTNSLAGAQALSDLSPPVDWQAAWAEWLSALAGGTSDEQIAFVHSLEIRTGEADTDEIVRRVNQELATIFGVDEQRVAPVVDALHRALRSWTTGGPPVTAESLCEALVLPPEPAELAPAPPPPSPFFPGRLPAAEDLERELLSLHAEPVFFLTAEPGSGKTSLVSWLTNRRPDRPFAALVGLRFFCFEPIRPESPFIAADASRVRPTELWFSLLAQLRAGLTGRLKELLVPLRNSLLDWRQARSHVIRLASQLGRESGRPFVIVVDGIDHAARAGQTNPQQAAEFLNSLPGPDELSGKHIRLLVAGQPAAAYESVYPTWLVSPHDGVRRVGLPGLEIDDVRELYQAAPSRLPPDSAEEAVRVIHAHARGNTLATVFAVAEAERVASVEALADRLRARRLADGPAAYYRSVWTSAIHQIGGAADDADDGLVVLLSIGRRGVTPESLAAAFAGSGRSVGWWARVLDALSPLLTLGADGYRVRHNDIRVFLAERRAGLSPPRQRRAASQLVDHLLSANADRASAHLHKLVLIDLAGRGAEWPRHFTARWVVEGGALSIDLDHLTREGVEAVRRLPDAHEWSVVVSVACALQTLDRLTEFKEFRSGDDVPRPEVPPFLPSEVAVRPVTEWESSHVRTLAQDVSTLCAHGDRHRAAALLGRWLGGLELGGVVCRVSGAAGQSEGGQPRQLDHDATVAFQDLGRACGQAGWSPDFGDYSETIVTAAQCAFERGYAEARAEANHAAVNADELFDEYSPRYLTAWETALRAIATQERWVLLRDLLSRLFDCRDSLSPRLKAEAAAWALRSGADADDPGWLDVLTLPGFGLSESAFRPTDEDDAFAPYVAVAFATGWRRLGLDPRDIAATVYAAYDPQERYEDGRAAFLAVLRVAALTGRVNAAIQASEAVPGDWVTPVQVGEAFDSLWGPVMTGNWRSPRRAAGRLAGDLIRLCRSLGGGHAETACRRALRYAEEYPVDFRWPSIWEALGQHGLRDVQRRWLEHWLGPSGKVWGLSHDEAPGIVRDFSPVAAAIGEQELAEQARQRVRWLGVGYRSRKEYGFAQVLDWFRRAARADPRSCRLPGRRLWELCDACRRQSGDNRLDEDVRVAVAAAAAACGAGEWWALVERGVTTEESWHSRTRATLVEGVTTAVTAGWPPPPAQWPYIWASALSLSYWHDEGDNAALRGLRDALLGAAAGADQRRLLLEALARTTRSGSLDRPPREAAADSSRPVVTNTAAVATAEVELALSGRVTLATAAAAASELGNLGDTGHDRVSHLLAAVGTEMGGSWDHSFHEISASLDDIVRHVSDDLLWQLIRAIGRDASGPASYHLHAAGPNLLAVALARSASRGKGELLAGVASQLDMHDLWAGEAPRPADDHGRPADLGPPSVGWREVAVQLVTVLLSSRSAEALNAAFEGAHALVDHDPTVIRDLLSEPPDEWRTYWLLHAAECWAARHPSAIASVRSQLEGFLQEGSLTERLQTWVVLCRHADVIGLTRPDFPSSVVAPSGLPLLAGNLVWPLHTPGRVVGHTRFSDRHSAVRAVLNDLRDCGCDFTHLGGAVAATLVELRGNNPQSRRNVLRRHGDIDCHELFAELAVGRVILPRLTMASCTPQRLVRLAQGFLDNDEPWLQRCPPRRSAEDTWPSQDDWPRAAGPGVGMEERLTEIARTLDVPSGWRVFSARVVFCVGGWDYILLYWHEPSPEDGDLSRRDPPSCPSGRTFLAWLGSAYEPGGRGGPLSVSGLFAGGRSRLHHARVEIHPARAWSEIFGWEPSPDDPLIWRCGADVVAWYERLHGPLRDSRRSPVHRLPVIDRWLVSEAGLIQIEQSVGTARPRTQLDAHEFKN